ncbi:MAG: pilus assembly protein PilM [Planctomycetaceae bacterium]
MSSTDLISRIISRTLHRRDNGWIGIDIGRHQLKLAQVQKKGNRWSLTQSDLLTLPEGEYAPNAVATIADRHLRSSSFTGRNVACVASNSVSELLTMELPDGTDEEHQLMIEQNLESGDESADEARQFAFWQGHFSRHLDDGMTQVNVVATKRQMVTTIAEGLFRSGLHCQVFDILPFAMVRAVSMLPGADDERPVAAFDWSGSTPMFMIIKNRIPIFTRQFRNCGVDHVVQLLCTKLGLNRQEAQHLLEVYNAGGTAGEVERNPVREAIAEIMAEPLKMLAREFEKTLAYVKQQRFDMWPDQLWILGGGASISSVETMLTSMTGIESRIWHLPQFTQHGSDVSPSRQALLSVAIALSSLAYDR